MKSLVIITKPMAAVIDASGARCGKKTLSFHPFPQVVDRFEEASFAAGAPILGCLGC